MQRKRNSIPAVLLAGLFTLPAMAHDEAATNRVAVILSAYPTDPALFQADVRPHVSRIIAAHGLEEWKATLVTNELHRHLGFYSIIGAKMGVRARELLAAPFDDVAVESHAGLKPPMSCLNDGLQVSTGASLGRGTIKIVESKPPVAEAVFEHDGKRLRLRVKKEILDRVRTDIVAAIEKHGNVTPAYFQAVRELAIHYWTNMKRAEIFDEQLLSN